MTAGAPAELEVTADASNVIPAIYAILITLAGATVLHQTKKIGVAVGSTHDGENVATVKASKHTVYARIVKKALGAAEQAPTRILTDNLSNQRVAANAQSASASRFFLVISTWLHQRIIDGEITVLHVPDPQNPSDFLTKFINMKKTEESIRYTSGKALGAAKQTLSAADAEMWSMFEPDVCSADFSPAIDTAECSPIQLGGTPSGVPPRRHACVFDRVGVCYRCGFPDGETVAACVCGNLFCLNCDYDSEDISLSCACPP
mmetsp:Transcript_19180/g.39137  ORF Transcript_19180/g.39137 Transcript_19180/m.39137 type:complete len:261 (+) Transcript_19180:882-1664(+)